MVDSSYDASLLPLGSRQIVIEDTPF
jgi:hypothetical protein